MERETITLPVIPNADPEISCIACNLWKCEYAIEVKGDKHVWMGLHERCRDLLDQRNQPKKSA